MNTRSLIFLLVVSTLATCAWAADQFSNILRPPPPPGAAKPMPSPPAKPLPTTPANQSQAKMHFASVIHDFGKLAGGEVAKCEFVFTNEGCTLLEVTDVRPGCGCTTAGQWTRQVEPGKTGSIPLQFNSANFNGPVVKTATVTCNDPAQQTIMLQLKANIWRPIDVSPQFAILNLTSEAPSNATIVRIVNNLDQPLILSEPESKNPAFTAEIKTVQPGKEFQLIVKTVPPFPAGSIQGQVSVKTSATNLPLITVTAWANMQQTVVAMPAQVILPGGGVPNNLTQTVWIRNNGSNGITLSDPVVTGIEGVKVLMKDFQPGRYFSLSMTFPAGLRLSSMDKAELSVKTSHPQYPVIKIPIIQSPMPPPVTPVSFTNSPYRAPGRVYLPPQGNVRPPVPGKMYLPPQGNIKPTATVVPSAPPIPVTTH